MLKKEDLERKNFKWQEFFASSTAEKNKILNYPDKGAEQAVLSSLMSTADNLVKLRSCLNKKKDNKTDIYIRILSGYRNEKLNKLVGGAKNSQHLQGEAIDFISNFGTPQEIWQFLKSENFECDQCIDEGTWIHISFKTQYSLNRKQFLKK